MKIKAPEYTPMSQPPKPKDKKDIVAEESERFEKEIVKLMAALKSQKLDRNKSIREIEVENKQFSDLVNAARRVELVEPAKGTMGLAIVAMRMLLFVNNRVNELAADFDQFKKEVLNRLPKEEDDEKAKD